VQTLKRDEMLNRAGSRTTPWDMVIIGGGATGLGIAVDAASRGYEVLLVEQADFAKGTSSRSTKLVHGGVRYLQQGNISLVMEALRERGILRRNAPHLVHDLPFVVPNYAWWESPYYGIGLKVYDLLAGKFGFPRSRMVSSEEALTLVPTIQKRGLRGGTLYYDGQFDDARLAINLARTAVEQGATVVNYVAAIGLTKSAEGMLNGVNCKDAESGGEFHAPAKIVINACGPLLDSVRRMDDPAAKPMIKPSQGVHLVFPKSVVPGTSAIMVPHTDDARVLFAIPWHGRAVIGTTDTEIREVTLEPRATEQEIDFILANASRYLAHELSRENMLAVYAGIRPLVGNPDDESTNTASVSRDFSIHISDSGLLTIGGGKWTTYRHMAEEAVNKAAEFAELPASVCVTKQLNIHGYHENPERFGDLWWYGTDAVDIAALIRSDQSLGEKLHPDLAIRAAEVVWAARNEMARTVEDVLSRRTRCLLLGANAAIECAPKVVAIMAKELNRDAGWQKSQVELFTHLARGYLPR
jgi:glycerol-3-phosphate dehydrogenase